MSSDNQARKPRKVREEHRNIVPPDLDALRVGVQRDYLRARDRYESAIAVLKSHTLWECADGRNLCDFDGDPWPCSTVSALAFIFDVSIKEAS